MKKIYTLNSCDTCRKMIKEVAPGDDVTMIDIKQEGILAKDLDAAAKKLGSYEALFSKKAVKYRTMGLNQKVLSEKEMRELILSEYTFLKRPLIIIGRTFISGATKESIGLAKEAIHGS
ncbi:MAG: hypothetical protein IPN29_10250 [Saprospiraceae bacterium]|nr:hypothetical protein [Saprospiraceae bacterium]